MSEKNLLSDLAAHLYATSAEDSGRTPSERELAEHFGVSRGQIRETLAVLEAMRIVERRAKSGIFLTSRFASVDAMALFAKAGLPLDPIQIYETVELRKIHEIKAAELASIARHRRKLRAPARDPRAFGTAAGRRRPTGRGGSRFPPRDRPRYAEHGVLQRLLGLLCDGRAPPARLFQRSRAMPPVPCRTHPDLRGAETARRESRPGADGLSPARRRRLLEGPDRWTQGDSRGGSGIDLWR